MWRMALPLVIAYHLVWTVYGYWLPNDPRGSMSRTIRNDVLADLGALHLGRKRVQPASRDLRAFYARAKEKLMHPLLEFPSEQIDCIASAFGATIRACRYTCYACAIMPDHVHVLIRKHRDPYEMMVANFQRESHLLLRERGFRDMEHPVWGGPGWGVFQDTPEDVRRTIKYIEDNPLKARMPARHWSFVKEYDGWPLHPGHSPNSPYARRLREPKP
jgi:REP element-mobilizing transposase RayT